MAAEDGLKAQKLLAQGSALGNVGKNKVALKGQKLSISKLLPFQGDFVVSILKPRALPWAKSFCPFRAYGMWLMIHPHCIFLFSVADGDTERDDGEDRSYCADSQPSYLGPGNAGTVSTQ